MTWCQKLGKWLRTALTVWIYEPNQYLYFTFVYLSVSKAMLIDACQVGIVFPTLVMMVYSLREVLEDKLFAVVAGNFVYKIKFRRKKKRSYQLQKWTSGLTVNTMVFNNFLVLVENFCFFSVNYHEIIIKFKKIQIIASLVQKPNIWFFKDHEKPWHALYVNRLGYDEELSVTSSRHYYFYLWHD